MTTQNVKELSIQVHLNGLSFSILNRSENSIELLEYVPFEHKITPFKALETLKHFLEKKELTAHSVSEVTVIHHNELSTFVPKELFSEDYSADYLKYNSKILQTDFITHDTLEINNSVNVYVPYVNINNFIFETFGEFTYKHSSTVLLNSILQSKLDLQTPCVFVNVNASMFEFVAISGNELILYNTFEFTTPEDFIYFILFTMEQLGYDPEKVKIILSGSIELEDKLYTILYTYIRHIEFMDDFCTYKFNSAITQKYKYYLLLNSF